MARINEESARKLSKRTQNVWVAFFVTIASAMFVLQISSKPNKAGLMAMLVSIEERPTEDPLFSSIEKADGAAWSSIVIHHLGQPTGTVEERWWVAQSPLPIPYSLRLNYSVVMTR